MIPGFHIFDIAVPIAFVLFILCVRIIYVVFIRKSSRRERALQIRIPWLRGLLAQITVSYVWVTVSSVLVLEILLIILFSMGSSTTNQGYIDQQVLETAIAYSNQISEQVHGIPPGPSFSFVLGETGSNLDISQLQGNNVPYISKLYPADQQVAFALFVDTNGVIRASSYPARYPVGMPLAQIAPEKSWHVSEVLKGGPQNGRIEVAGIVQTEAFEPVVSYGKVIGVISVQVPLIDNQNSLWSIIPRLLSSTIGLIVLTAPIGALFSLITTRKLVRRLHALKNATALVANGRYEQRVQVMRKDELGQLEQQFNRMAEQLGESIAQGQQLAEQNARLAERARISRELHDAISQNLFSLHMLAGGLQTAVPADSPLHEEILTLKQTTATMMREMRALLLELRPAQLEHLGLADALEDIATAYRSRLSITVTTSIASITLPAQLEHALLRITQEAFSNAARHANASALSLALSQCEDMVRLVITDNGKGFVPDTNGMQHGLGLKLMQERAQELCGSFTLCTSPGQGTSIYVNIPYKVAAEEIAYDSCRDHR